MSDLKTKKSLKQIKIKHKINSGSIFIYTIHNNQILLLLGKENNTPYNKTDVNLYSEFHGNFINDESIEQAISRIMFEKTMNLIIDSEKMEELIIMDRLDFIIDKKNNNIIYLLKINYEDHKNVTKYYNKIFIYLNFCTTNNSFGNKFIESCPIGFLDKSELNWFSYKDIMEQNKIFSEKFYSNLYKIIDKIK